jgi:hypothetical protein
MYYQKIIFQIKLDEIIYLGYCTVEVIELGDIIENNLYKKAIIYLNRLFNFLLNDEHMNYNIYVLGICDNIKYNDTTNNYQIIIDWENNLIKFFDFKTDNYKELHDNFKNKYNTYKHINNKEELTIQNIKNIQYKITYIINYIKRINPLKYIELIRKLYTDFITLYLKEVKYKCPKIDYVPYCLTLRIYYDEYDNPEKIIIIKDTLGNTVGMYNYISYNNNMTIEYFKCYLLNLDNKSAFNIFNEIDYLIDWPLLLTET